MPEISRFYGLIIKMYFRASEHNPSHFHVIYGEYFGEIDLNTLEMLEGDLPPRALSMVQEWAKEHQTELKEIWDTQEFKKIPPLR